MTEYSNRNTTTVKCAERNIYKAFVRSFERYTSNHKVD